VAFTYTYVYTYINIHICTYTYIYTYAYASDLYIYVHMRESLRLLLVTLRICIYIHVHTNLYASDLYVYTYERESEAEWPGQVRIWSHVTNVYMYVYSFAYNHTAQVSVCSGHTGLHTGPVQILICRVL